MSRRPVRTFGRLAALAAAAAALAAPAGAHAALSPERAVIQDLDGNGVVAPGDGVEFWQDVRNTDPDNAEPGFTAGMTAMNGGILGTATSAYAAIAPGGVGRNATPFTATVPTDWTCGRVMRFSMSAGSGTVVGVEVPTGLPAASAPYDSGDVPKDISASLPPTLSAIDVPAGGVAVVKDVRVRIGELRHTWDGDLSLRLIAPDGTTAQLASGVGGSGHDFLGTVFTSDPAAAPLGGASAPLTGAYRVDALSRFEGIDLAGRWQLHIVDGNGADNGTLVSWGLDIAVATCDAQPMASLSATPNPARPGLPVTLDASGSRTIPGRTITRYEWDYDGDGTWDATTASPTTTTTYASRGQAHPAVKIVDDGGGFATTTLLLPVTTPPTAALQATPDNPLSGDVVHLDASASRDAAGKLPARYQWDLDGDNVFERDTGTTPWYDGQFPKPGVRKVHVRVTDDLGATAQAEAVVTIGNRAPHAALSAPAAVATGSTVALSAAGSADADGTVDSYAWDLDGDGAFDDATGATATTSFPVTGPYTVAVRVTDDLGATDVAGAEVYASASPVASLDADKLAVRPGEIVHFDAGASHDPDTAVLAFAWDLDGDGTFEVDTAAVPTLDQAFAVGRHTVSVRVTGDHGVAAEASVVIDVVTTPPVAALTASTLTPTVGQTVIFDASGSSDPDGTIASYRWDLDGDGTFETAAGPTAERAYPNAGPVTVGVRVTDNDGVRALARVLLDVKPAPAPPPPSDPPPGDGGGAGPAPGAGSGSGGAGDGGGGGYGGSSQPTGPFNPRLGGAPIQSMKAAIKRGVTLTCATDRAATCRVTAKVSAADARRLKLAPRKGKRRPVVVGRLTLITTAAGEARGYLRLTAAAKRRFKRVRSVSLILEGAASDTAGHQVQILRAALLRR